jgi:putative phosphoribosyl transferase
VPAGGRGALTSVSPAGNVEPGPDVIQSCDEFDTGRLSLSFRNRSQAGQQLAAALAHYRGEPATVLALPRGGVPVAAEVARVLRAPLDLILVRKIGVPFQPELAMGAVVDGPEPVIVRNDDVIAMTGVSESEFNQVWEREIAEIGRRRQRYLANREHAPIAGRVVIVIDDGIATGATVRAALRATRARDPRKLILAVPVAPTSTIQDLQGEADQIICLEQHETFGAIGFFYADFRQVSDHEVVDLLARHPAITANNLEDSPGRG